MRPVVCDRLERIAQVENPRATVWKGGGVPTNEQGIKVLGTPLGHDDFVAHHLREVAREQQELLDTCCIAQQQEQITNSDQDTR